MEKVLCSGGGDRRVGVFVCSDHHKLTVFLVVGCVCCSDVC